MSRLKIATNINIDLEFETAPFHKRLLAWLIDFVLFIVYLFLISKVIAALPVFFKGEDIYWTILIFLLPIALYHVVTESLMQGQTVGKRILHIKVINETGGNATFSQFIIRWMLRISDLILLIMIILFSIYKTAVLKEMFFVVALALTDIFCVALTAKGQRIGDMAAGTLLINTRNKNSLNETVFMEIEDSYVPLYPEVMKLSDRDINMIKNIYDGLQKKYNYDLAERTAYKVMTVLNITTKQDPISFLVTLLKDYNHLSTK
jgi:uncharacterized RDD family membrane protein YckC